MRYSRWFATWALLFSTGCIPNRNNLYDPLNAPHAALEVVDTGSASAGVCPSLPAGTFPAVTQTTRGRCLALSASGSLNNDGKTATGLRYEFQYPDGTTTGSTTNPILLIPDATREAFPLASSQQPLLTFQVTVTDAAGHPATASATIALDAVKPQAVAPAPQILPLGGYPWSPGKAFSATLDGSRSVNSDQDQIHYCWTIAPAAESCGDLAVIQVPIPASPASVVRLKLRVFTGPLLSAAPPTDPRDIVSDASSTIIVVGQQGNWALTAELSASDTVLARVDPIAPILVQADFDIGIANWAGSQGDAVAFLADLQSTTGQAIGLYVAGVENGTAGPQVDRTGPSQNAVSTAGGAIYQDPSGELWTLLSAGQDGFFLDGYFLGAPGSPIPGAAFEATLVPPAEIGVVGNLVTGSAGRLWFDAGGPDLYLLDSGSVTHTVVPGSTVAMASRPETSEVWLMKNSFPANPDAIYRIEADLPAQPSLQLPNIQLGGLAWINRDEVWIWVQGDGARRVSVPLLENCLAQGEECLELATLVRAPFPEPLASMNADPNTGVLWATFFGSGARIALDGTSISNTENPAKARIAFIDPYGRVWAFSFNALLSSQTADPLGEMASTIIPVQFDPQGGIFLTPSFGVDRSTGGVWTTNVASLTFDHVAADGTIDRRVPHSLQSDVSQVAFDPDGSGGWEITATPTTPGSPYVELSGLYRISFGSSGSVEETPVLAQAALSLVSNTVFAEVSPSLLVTTFPLFSASAPLPSSTPFLWTEISPAPFSTELEMATIDGNGTINANAFVVDPQRQAFAEAASPRTNNLCVVAVVDTSSSRQVVTMAWLSPTAGSPPTSFAVPLPTPSDGGQVALQAMGISDDPASPGADACWVVYSESSGAVCTTTNLLYHLRAYDMTKQEVASVDTPLTGQYLVQFLPLSSHSLYLQLSSQCANLSAPADRMFLTNNSGVWSATPGTSFSFDLSNQIPVTNGGLIDPAGQMIGQLSPGSAFQ